MTNSTQVISNLPLQTVKDYLDLLDNDQSPNMIASLSFIQYIIVMINEFEPARLPNTQLPANLLQVVIDCRMYDKTVISKVATDTLAKSAQGIISCGI